MMEKWLRLFLQSLQKYMMLIDWNRNIKQSLIHLKSKYFIICHVDFSLMILKRVIEHNKLSKKPAVEIHGITKSSSSETIE